MNEWHTHRNTCTHISMTKTQQDKAGVTVSVARVAKLLRRAHPGKRVGKRGPIYLTGAVDELAQIVLQGALQHARGNKAKRVHVADLIQAVRTDPDLSRAFGGFSFSSHLPSLKPINFILPQEGEDGQKERRRKIKANKEKAATRRAEAAEEAAGQTLDD